MTKLQKLEERVTFKKVNELRQCLPGFFGVSDYKTLQSKLRLVLYLYVNIFMESQEKRAKRNIRSIAKSISELKKAMEALSPSERGALPSVQIHINLSDSSGHDLAKDVELALLAAIDPQPMPRVEELSH